MAQGGIFRFDPPPVQRAPTVPLGTPGDQPPRSTIHQQMASVLASWPTGIEHGFPQPDHRQRRTAPLTLTYGQQPPLRTIHQSMTLVLASWATWMEQATAGPQYQWDARLSVVQTLVYGDTPPFTKSQGVTAEVLQRSWQPLEAFQRRLSNIAHLVEPIASSVPIDVRQGVQLGVVLRAWQSTDNQPQQDTKKTALLGLTYGDQPPVNSAQLKQNGVIARTWQPPDPQPQRDPKNLAPLTLPYGDQPTIDVSRHRQNEVGLRGWQTQPEYQRRSSNIAALLATPAIVPSNHNQRLQLGVIARAWVSEQSIRQTSVYVATIAQGQSTSRLLNLRRGSITL